MKNLQITINYNEQTGLSVEANREADSQEAAAIIMVALIKTLQFAKLDKKHAKEAINQAFENNWEVNA